MRKERRKKDELTGKQKLFVREYLVDQNITQAAIRAGYSARSASVTGWETLRIPKVAEEIRRLLKERFSRPDLMAEKILLELFRCGNYDIAEAYDENGNLKPIHEIPEDVRRAIVSVETEQELGPEVDGEATMITVRKVKFADKARNNELLARHFKLLVDRIEIKDTTVADRLAAAKKRLKTG